MLKQNVQLFEFHNENIVSSHMTLDIHSMHVIAFIKQTMASSLCAKVPSARPRWRQAINGTPTQQCGRIKRLVFPKQDTNRTK